MRRTMDSELASSGELQDLAYQRMQQQYLKKSLHSLSHHPHHHHHHHHTDGGSGKKGMVPLAQYSTGRSSNPSPAVTTIASSPSASESSSSSQSQKSSSIVASKKTPYKPSTKKEKGGCCCCPPNCCCCCCRPAYGGGCYPHNPGPGMQETMCYDPQQKQIYQAPCQIGVIPMRSAAFQAPHIPLPRLCDRVLRQQEEEEALNGEEEEDEDGVQFQFKPQTNCRTEVTFTIEPKTQPPWLTMLNCGFKPMVNCSAPPCYLSPNGNPGTDFFGGQQSFVNHAFGTQMAYGGLANFPTMDQIKNAFGNGAKIQDSESTSSTSSSSSEDDDDDDEEEESVLAGHQHHPRATYNHNRNTTFTEVSEDDQDHENHMKHLQQLSKKYSQRQSHPHHHNAHHHHHHGSLGNLSRSDDWAG